MAAPVTASGVIPTDMDPPPSYYDCAIKMGAWKNQPVNLLKCNQGPEHKQSQIEDASAPDTKGHDEKEKPSRKQWRHLGSFINIFFWSAIAIFDLATSANSIVSLSQYILENKIEVAVEMKENLDKASKGNPNATALTLLFFKDYDLVLMKHSFMFLLELIKFMMGVVLIAGLRSPTDTKKVKCFQIWIYGAYVLMYRDSLYILRSLFRYIRGSHSEEGKEATLIRIFNFIFRMVLVGAMRRYKKHLAAGTLTPSNEQDPPNLGNAPAQNANSGNEKPQQTNT